MCIYGLKDLSLLVQVSRYIPCSEFFFFQCYFWTPLPFNFQVSLTWWEKISDVSLFLIHQDYSKEHPDHLVVELYKGSIRLSVNLGLNSVVVTSGKDLNDGQFHTLKVVLFKTKVEVTVESNACAGGTCKATTSALSSDGSTFNGKPTMGGVGQLTPIIRTQIASDGNFIGCIEVSQGAIE